MEPNDQTVRDVIHRSLPFIEEKGRSWIEQKDCVSCHRIDMMVWSLEAARRYGFDVSDSLTNWTDWAVASSLALNDEGVPTGRTNKEGVAHLLLAGRSLIPSPDVRSQLVALIQHEQRSDGTWKAGGQLPSQKRPASETDAVSTMWLALTLSGDRPPASDPVIEAALKAVAAGPVGISTEWHMLHILLACEHQRFEVRDEGVASLRAAQQSDGGWGWLIANPSDALGTGMALYALRAAGADRADPAALRARRFLIESQHNDGSWPVNGTKEKKRNNLEETATYWGTTWAVLGLLATLPDPSENSVSADGTTTAD